LRLFEHPDFAVFQPPLGKRGIDRELKKLSDTIGKHPALSFEKNEIKTIGGFGRNGHFSYTQRFGGRGEVANRVLVEAGAASGREPSEIVELRSYVSQFLKEKGNPSARMMKARFHFGSCTYGGHSSKRCSRFTARLNY